LNAFYDALMDCRLEDLDFSGDKFTWKRGHIRERLDRAVATGSWSTMHPGAGVEHLNFNRFDHWPILLDMEAQLLQVGHGPRPKHFEARWLMEKSFSEKV
jgi:hypothetical protein